MIRKTILFFSVFLTSYDCFSQRDTATASLLIPHTRKWVAGIGFCFTTTSKEVTEEQRRRLPALDLKLVRKVNQKILLYANLRSDIVQNHISMGPSYIIEASKKSFFSIGNDIAYWHGLLKIEQLDYRGYGFLDYPNLTYGYKFRKDNLIALRGELILNISNDLKVGELKIIKKEKTFSGYAISFYLEQPFVKDKYISLGFSALYTDFYWGTWFLFETFHRRIFYPQITAHIIL